MKPQLLKVPYGPDHSFSVRRELSPNVNNRWHYHPEVELIHFHNGFGTQFIGDHISQFEPGDIVLVGCNLPHFWKYDEIYFRDPEHPVPYSTVIHFFENFMGERFLLLPETRPIKNLLERSKRGIRVKGLAAKGIADLIAQVYQAEGVYRITALIGGLTAIALSEHLATLSSLGFKYEFPDADNKRINAIYSYAFNHFHEKIKLEEVASVAQLTPNSFCRYFRRLTGKTFSDFITEIRVGYACKLLIANQSSVKQICYESGFNNFSCFHRQFKTMTGETPQHYQKKYR